MSETENKLEILEAKVIKLVDAHKKLTEENNLLKQENEKLKNNIVGGTIGSSPVQKGPGRPLKSKVKALSLEDSDFSDVRKVKKMIDELVIEIDKSIKKLSD
jgi:regulator of replication initiation timing